jgi:hypothetical protein
VSRRGGAVVVLAGPDGAGKSTLSRDLSAVWTSVPVAQLHHRPGILGGRTPAGSPASNPQRERPYPRLLSGMKLLFLWLDFELGWWLRYRRFVRTGGVLLHERGWWDIAIDPLRYRLRPMPRLVHALNRFLPKPDVTIVLEGDPQLLLARKRELPVSELHRQMRAWRGAGPHLGRVVYLDSSRPRTRLAREVREVIEAILTPRMGRGGWVHLPSRARSRWIVPRGPRSLARSGFSVYQPVTARARLGWEISRILAGWGFLKLLPDGPGPDRDLIESLADFMSADGSLSVVRSNHPDRYVVALLDKDGQITAVGKIAQSVSSCNALAREASAIETLGEFLPPPLVPPTILAKRPGLLLFEAAKWRPRRNPWLLPSEVAAALGGFYRSAGGGQDSGPRHGDFAPWNLLRTSSGWILVDWEEANRESSPFFDVFHYLVQSHVLLGRPKAAEVVRAAYGEGSVGAPVRAYAGRAHLDVTSGSEWFVRYLQESTRNLNPRTTEGRLGLSARRRLSARV